MSQTFSFHYDNRGKLGQTPSFNPDNDRNGLWLEGSTDGSESGGIFMNGNVMCLWSPGDNDLLRIYDEDSFSTPKFVIDRSGNVLVFGDLFMKSPDNEQTVHISGEHGDITLGSQGHDGDLLVRSSDNVRTVHINGEHGNITLGGQGHDGDLLVRSSDNVRTVHIDGEHGNIHLGGQNHDGDLIIKNKDDQNSIHLNGDTGDITLLNADAAEDFDVRGDCEVTPGTVMVIDAEGGLRESDAAYDKKVAGVVSGAGKFRPGLVLDRRLSDSPRIPVALMGKVHCKVDARYGAVEVGDLLTTSPTPGHAMKVKDPLRAFGAVIGKALNPLPEDLGMIPVLVALQ